MPEHDCLPPDVSATEFVSHMARVSGLPAGAARERTADVLRHVGLYEERYRQIGGYSTGMKQRVKLAQALVHDPRLLFLDEPTNGLDPAGRDEMLALIERIGRDFGITTIVASHLLGEIERIAGWLVAIDAGRLLRTAPLDELHRAHRPARRRDRGGGRSAGGAADGTRARRARLRAQRARRPRDRDRRRVRGLRRRPRRGGGARPAAGADRASAPPAGGPLPRRRSGGTDERVA